MDRIYGLFHEAKNRCANPRNKDYGRYGGRGIRFEFDSVEQLRAALGPRPKGATLDRIDNDGPYKPDNCRWATRLQQGRNNSRSLRIQVGSEFKTATELAETIGVNEATIRWRLRHWPRNRLLESMDGRTTRWVR